MQDAQNSMSTPSTTKNQIRRIQTFQFGEIEVKSKYIYIFPEGLLGFEELREFVIISQVETEPFKWLLSIEDPTIGFPALNPYLLDLQYHVSKNFIDEHSALLVIVTLSNSLGQMTANMKAPIVLDVEKQLGKQVIISSERYSPEYIIGNTQRNSGGK